MRRGGEGGGDHHGQVILGSQPPQKKDLGASPLNFLNLIREALPGAGRTLGCDFFRNTQIRRTALEPAGTVFFRH